MQTFLPYISFEESAACLDYRRLGKQRLEAKQLLNAIQPDYKRDGEIILRLECGEATERLFHTI